MAVKGEPCRGGAVEAETGRPRRRRVAAIGPSIVRDSVIVTWLFSDGLRLNDNGTPTSFGVMLSSPVRSLGTVAHGYTPVEQGDGEVTNVSTSEMRLPVQLRRVVPLPGRLQQIQDENHRGRGRCGPSPQELVATSLAARTRSFRTMRIPLIPSFNS